MIEDNTRLFVPELLIRPPPGVSPQDSGSDPGQALRLATRALHGELDQKLPLAREGANIADYAMHLCVLRDWQVALKPWLMRTGKMDSSLGLIAADLADCADSEFPQPAAPDMAAVQNADDGSEAFCWGIAYVLEGSRLGGEVLYRRLQPRLKPHPLRYLGERAEGSQPWPQFLATLRQKLAGGSASHAGCNGAVAAFQTLQAHFTRQGALA